jgi:hypothetical protein
MPRKKKANPYDQLIELRSTYPSTPSSPIPQIAPIDDEDCSQVVVTEEQP